MIGCRFPGCEVIANYRGLCINHYRRLQGAVRRKEPVTWAMLEEFGVCAQQIRGKDGKLRKESRRES